MSDTSALSEYLASVTRFIKTEVTPRELEIEERGRIPQDLRERAAQMGLFGYALPTQYDGQGLGLVADVELNMLFGETNLAFRGMLGTNNGIAGQVLVAYGSDDQRAEWLPRMASGEVVAGFALTEEGAGSNPRGLRTRAERCADGWRLTGTKRFISNAPVAQLLIVFARYSLAGDERIGAFLVPTDLPGVVLGPPEQKMGQSGALSGEVTLDGVSVPDGSLVGGTECDGLKVALASVTRGRMQIAGLAVGAAKRCLDESIEHARASEQAGVRIGSFELVQAMLADQTTLWMSARAMARAVAAQCESGGESQVAPAAAKLFCTEAAGRAADLAVQVHGGLGYMRSTPVERIYRDVRLLRIYEGTSEILRLIIGRGVQGRAVVA